MDNATTNHAVAAKTTGVETDMDMDMDTVDVMVVADNVDKEVEAADANNVETSATLAITDVADALHHLALRPHPLLLAHLPLLHHPSLLVTTVDAREETTTLSVGHMLLLATTVVDAVVIRPDGKSI